MSTNVAGADIPHSHYSGGDHFICAIRFKDLSIRDANLKSQTGQATKESCVTDAYLILVPLSCEDAGLAHEKDFGAPLGTKGKKRMNKHSGGERDQRGGQISAPRRSGLELR